MANDKLRNALSKYGLSLNELSDADTFVASAICEHGKDNRNWIFLSSSDAGFDLQRQRLMASNSNHFRVFDVSNGLVLEIDPRLYDVFAANIMRSGSKTGGSGLKLIDNEARLKNEFDRFYDYFDGLRSQMITSREVSPVIALYSYNASKEIQQDGQRFPAFSLTYDEADALIRKHFWFNLSPRNSGVISSRQTGIFYTFHFGA